jgi:hypothetical protein
VSEVNNHIFETIDRQNRHESAHTRRKLVQATAAGLGSMGLLGFAASAADAQVSTAQANSVETLTTVAATAEVLATIVNTVGAERLGSQMDAVTLRNIRAAAQQEKNHYELLTSRAVGAKAATTMIHVPDAVFSSPQALLTTLVVGDQLFVNAYLLACTVFARQGTLAGSRSPASRRRSAPWSPSTARWPCSRWAAWATIAPTRSSRSARPSRACPPRAPRACTPAPEHVAALESVGFGFGKAGSAPGQMYSYAEVSARTPTDPDVNTLSPS